MLWVRVPETNLNRGRGICEGDEDRCRGEGCPKERAIAAVGGVRIIWKKVEKDLEKEAVLTLKKKFRKKTRSHVTTEGMNRSWKS